MIILVLASYAPSLINFRLDLIRDLKEARHEVVTAAPGYDPDVARQLDAIGVGYEPIKLDHAGINPLRDIGSLISLVKLFRRTKPDLVFAYTIKPVVYGLLAARLTGVRQRFALITGISYALIGGDGLKRRLLKGLTVRLYRHALRGAAAVLFQNPSDREAFVENGMMRPGQKTAVVDGSGVNLDRFAASVPPDGSPVFLMMARLLADKGVREYVDAARQLMRDHPDWRFQLLGPLDVTPTAISQSEIDAWQQEGVIDYLGATKDVRPYLKACTAFVLPSYYPEGLPRSILEAMAIGRAIVTTDHPGCRETVIEGENGHLVPAGEAAPLAAAMASLGTTPGHFRAFGEASRAMAEQRFDVRLINQDILRILGLADGRRTSPAEPSMAEVSLGSGMKKLHEASL